MGYAKKCEEEMKISHKCLKILQRHYWVIKRDISNWIIILQFCIKHWRDTDKKIMIYLYAVIFGSFVPLTDVISSKRIYFRGVLG